MARHSASRATVPCARSLCLHDSVRAATTRRTYRRALHRILITTVGRRVIHQANSLSCRRSSATLRLQRERQRRWTSRLCLRRWLHVRDSSNRRCGDRRAWSCSSCLRRLLPRRRSLDATTLRARSLLPVAARAPSAAWCFRRCWTAETRTTAAARWSGSSSSGSCPTQVRAPVWSATAWAVRDRNCWAPVFSSAPDCNRESATIRDAAAAARLQDLPADHAGALPNHHEPHQVRQWSSLLPVEMRRACRSSDVDAVKGTEESRPW